MQAIVDRAAFVAAVNGAFRASLRNGSIPILSNILLRPSVDRISIVGTHCAATFEASILATISGTPLSTTVNGAACAGVIGKLKGESLALEWQEEGRSAQIKSGRSRYDLPTLPEADFPPTPMFSESTRFSIARKILLHAFTSTQFAVQRDRRTRAHLTGVYWHQDTDASFLFGGISDCRRLVLTATDGFEFARFSTDVPTGASGAPNIIVPDTAVAEIARLLGDSSEENVEMELSADRIAVTDRSNRFSARLIDGTYPDYVRALSHEQELFAILDVDEFAGALHRLKVIDSDSRTRLVLTSGEMRLTLVNPANGNAEETMDVEYDGAEWSVGIRVDGILSILGAMKAERCRLRFCADVRAPFLMNAMRGDVIEYHRTFATMPMLISKRVAQQE